MRAVKKHSPEGCLSPLLTCLIYLAAMILLFSCAVEKQPQYKVLSVEKIKRSNAYRIKTDSFTVVRIVRGAGKYKPKTISKQGYFE